MPAPAAEQPPQKLSTKSAVLRQPQTTSRTSRDILDKIEEQLSEDRLRGILANLVQPLRAEVTELREKLAVNARRNRFEVSLGYIPPELEEKLSERLRQDLGTRVLQQTREQSSEMLGSAKTAIEQRISAALTEFRHRLSGELHGVEHRAQVLSKELTTAAQHRVRAGIETLQQQALETEAHLNAQGEKLLCSLQGQLVDSHHVHRREIEQIQADAAAKASHLQSEVSDLGARIAALNESVRRLESDLDAHLESIAGEIVSDARTQLEYAVALTLKDLQARGSNEVETRLSGMCGHMRTIQNRIESSFSGSLTAQGGGGPAIDRAAIRGTRPTIPRKVAAYTRQGLKFGGEYSGPTTSPGTRIRGRPKLDCYDSIVQRCHDGSKAIPVKATITVRPFSIVGVTSPL